MSKNTDYSDFHAETELNPSKSVTNRQVDILEIFHKNVSILPLPTSLVNYRNMTITAGISLKLLLSSWESSLPFTETGLRQLLLRKLTKENLRISNSSFRTNAFRMTFSSEHHIFCITTGTQRIFFWAMFRLVLHSEPGTTKIQHKHILSIS